MIMVECLLKLMTKGSASTFLLVMTIIKCLPLSEFQHPRLTASKAVNPEPTHTRMHPSTDTHNVYIYIYMPDVKYSQVDIHVPI